MEVLGQRVGIKELAHMFLISTKILEEGDRKGLTFDQIMAQHGRKNTQN
jgi:hypothetical protein